MQNKSGSYAMLVNIDTRIPDRTQSFSYNIKASNLDCDRVLEYGVDRS